MHDTSTLPSKVSKNLEKMNKIQGGECQNVCDGPDPCCQEAAKKRGAPIHRSAEVMVASKNDVLLSGNHSSIMTRPSMSKSPEKWRSPRRTPHPAASSSLGLQNLRRPWPSPQGMTGRGFRNQKLAPRAGRRESCLAPRVRRLLAAPPSPPLAARETCFYSGSTGGLGSPGRRRTGDLLEPFPA
jgi:hypothetical protein